jgi:hypothetical protein
VIPRTLGIDDGDGAAGADAQAIRLRPVNQRIRADEVQFLEAHLEKIPRGERLFARAAFGVRGVHAKEDMPAKFFEAERFNGGLEFGIHFLFRAKDAKAAKEINF